MPRSGRCSWAGAIFHVVNRGVERRRVYLDEADYERFLVLLQLGKDCADIKVYGFCLMPNHFHIVLEPQAEGAMSRYLQWVTGRYAAELRTKTQTRGLGHVFQQRYWNRGCDGVDDFFLLLRYVEANAHRANLVWQAEAWQWGSLYARQKGDTAILDPPPFELPAYWTALVNRPQLDRELAFARFKPKRGRPLVIE